MRSHQYCAIGIFLPPELSTGFTVISEVGKKNPKKNELITLEHRIKIMQRDLESESESGLRGADCAETPSPP
ncbi:hypothetical protein ES703_12401 [subsurface metagenome]